MTERQIRVLPTKSGNGFTAGQPYVFTREPNSRQYVTKNDDGELRYESLDNLKGKFRSAHLGDKNDFEHGRWRGYTVLGQSDGN